MSNACLGVARTFAFSSVIPCRHVASSITPSFSRNALYSSPFARLYSIVTTKRHDVSSLRKNPTSLEPFSTPSHTIRYAFHSTSSPEAKKPKQVGASKTREKRPDRVVPEGKRIQFPFGTIPSDELATIFGENVALDRGNDILRILHERRVAGSLIDKGVDIGNETVTSPAARMKALEWLRKKYPVDEQKAAEAWAERIGRRVTNSEEVEAAEAELNNTSAQTTTSMLEQWIQARKEKKMQQEEERKNDPEVQKSEQLALQKAEEHREANEQLQVAKAKRMKEREKNAMINQDDEPPKQPPLSDLVIPTLFGLSVMLLAFVYGDIYNPPQRSNRMFPDTPASITTIGAIFTINLLVCIGWKYAPLWKFLNRFTLQFPAYPMTPNVLLNIFSHQHFKHLALNMAGLAMYGVSVHEDIGRGNFLAIYTAGGITGALFSLWYHVAANRLRFYSCGASGAVWAIMTAWAYLTWCKPSKPTDSWAFYYDSTLYGTLVLQIFAHFTPGIMNTIDVMSHFGGALIGLICATLMNLRNEHQKREEFKTDDEKRQEAVESARKDMERKSQAAHEHWKRKIKQEGLEHPTHKPSFVKVDR